MSPKEEMALFISGLIVGGAVCASMAVSIVTKSWEDDMVKRGFANYSQTTGKWQWVSETNGSEQQKEAGH